MASLCPNWSAVLCAGFLHFGCREAPPPPPLQKDNVPAIPASTIAFASSALPSPSASVAGPKPAPPKPALSCWDWLDPERDAPAGPFPHPIEPGNAMGRVLDWAERHKIGKQPSILLENVHCPRTRCIDPDDCWFHIKLDDSASTATSHMILWMESMCPSRPSCSPCADRRSSLGGLPRRRRLRVSDRAREEESRDGAGSKPPPQEATWLLDRWA